MKPETLRHWDELQERAPILEVCREPLMQAVEAVCAMQRRGGKLLICGNGGSASDAQHISGELGKAFQLSRKLKAEDAAQFNNSSLPDGDFLARNLENGIATVVLSAHEALATAIANDGDAGLIFAQQVWVLARPGDILLAISTSGNSRNIVLALQTARAVGITSIGLTGMDKARMDEFCDILIKAPARGSVRVQELHLPLYHALCLMAEQELFE